MGKKQSGNTKAEAANAKKASIQANKDAQKSAKAEELEAKEWAKGSNARAERRREDEERKQQAIADKKLEKKRLEALESEVLQEDKGMIRKSKQKKETLRPWEEALMSNAKKTAKPMSLPESKSKVTRAMIQKSKEEQEQALKKPNKKDILFQTELVSNRNRDTSMQEEARDIDQAIGLLSVTNDEAEKHPERRVKAAYKAFEEAKLSQLKEEFPGLKLSQYKQKLSEMWKRSPQNPLNQKSVAYNYKKP